MPLIDDRGQLFGKINLIDALVVAIGLGLIPLAYGAILLFRLPTPIVASVEPSRMTQGVPTILQLTGEYLRPFLRARLGKGEFGEASWEGYESSGFLVQSPTFAEVKVPDLPPGIYDLVLFDQATELVRVSRALTVVIPPPRPEPEPEPEPPPSPPLPQTELQVVGELVGLTRKDARLIRMGLTFSRSDEAPTGEILAVRPAKSSVYKIDVGPNSTSMDMPTWIMVPKEDEVHLSAIIRVRCSLVGNACQVGDVSLTQGATIILPLPGAPDNSGVSRSVTFVIEEVRPADAGVAFLSRRIDLRAVGEFVGLTSGEAQLIQSGLRLGSRGDELAAEVLAVRAPEPRMHVVVVGGSTVTVPVPGEVQVPATIGLSCLFISNATCMVGNTVLAPNTTITLPVPSEDGSAEGPHQTTFVIRELLPRSPLPALSPARLDVQVVGEFFGLTEADARLVQVGAKLQRWEHEPIAEVLAVRAPEPGIRRIKVGGSTPLTIPADGERRVRAIIRINCVVTLNQDCLFRDKVLAQNTTITLPLSPRAGDINFFIDEVRQVDEPAEFPSVRVAVATVRVRFVAEPEVLAVMNVGDVDLSGSVPLAGEERAVLMEVGSDQQTVTAQTYTQGLLQRNLQVEESVLSFTGTVRVPVVSTGSGWSYRKRLVKVGATFTFETATGAMIGWIVDMGLGDERVRESR